MTTPRISAIAAVGRNRELGREGKLLWHIPADLNRFKELTGGHPVIMGRKTWGSLPEKFRPLPNRDNVVITRQPEYEAPGAKVTHSLEEALKYARTQNSKEIFIIGGAEIYKQALPVTDRLYLTLIDAEDQEADSFFPEYEKEFEEVETSDWKEEDGIRYRFTTLGRE